jgi:hypothetical protein
MNSWDRLSVTLTNVVSTRAYREMSVMHTTYENEKTLRNLTQSSLRSRWRKQFGRIFVPSEKKIKYGKDSALIGRGDMI